MSPEFKCISLIIGSLDSKKWNRDEVYRRIIVLVSLQISMKEEDILPNHHFIDDLGMG